MIEAKKKPGVVLGDRGGGRGAAGVSDQFRAGVLDDHATGIGSSAIPIAYRPIVRLAGQQWGYPGLYRTRWNPIIVSYARLGIDGDDWPSGNNELLWATFRGNTTW